MLKSKRLATALQLERNTEFYATLCKHCSLVKNGLFALGILLKLRLVGPSSILWELSSEKNIIESTLKNWNNLLLDFIFV